MAVRYRTPVILLSDTFLASSSEPWQVPDVADLPAIDAGFAAARDGEDEPEFLPYGRDEDLARPWAIPGTPGLQHRIGGLEKTDGSGNISYDGANHQLMTDLRAAKIDGVEVPALEVDADPDATLLVLGWGSSEGVDSRGRAAREARRSQGRLRAHCATCNPLPANTGDVLRSFDRVVVPEMNTGQLAQVLRAKYLVDVESFCKVQGLPLYAAEIERRSRSVNERRNQRTRRQRRGGPAGQGRLPVRPGDAVVPRLRGLRGAVGRPAVHAGAGDPAGADRVHHRHRLRRDGSPTT